MTENAQSELRDLGEAYVKAGYPNYFTWYVIPDQRSASAFRELAAHGYVEPFMNGWRLSTTGLHWVVAAHPMGEAARRKLRTIREEYIRAGYPERQGWYVVRGDAESIEPFQELDSRGFIEAFGTGYKMWFLTEGGLQTMLKDGGA